MPTPNIPIRQSPDGIQTTATGWVCLPRLSSSGRFVTGDNLVKVRVPPSGPPCPLQPEEE